MAPTLRLARHGFPEPRSEKAEAAPAVTGGSLAVLALIAAGMVLALLGPALPTAQRANLWIGTVQRGDPTIHVRADGVLVPELSRWIAAASGAEVDHILVPPALRSPPIPC